MTRTRMIELLNEDLAGKHRAIVAYTVYSQAEAMRHFASNHTLRAIIVQEQDHETDLRAALRTNGPVPTKPSDTQPAQPTSN